MNKGFAGSVVENALTYNKKKIIVKWMDEKKDKLFAYLCILNVLYPT
jgi:hypothetical protein